MASDKLLLRGGQVYDHDGDVHKPASADILIENGDIAAVGPNLEAGGAEIVDARGKLVVPGLINAHYHSHDTLCRGLFEELPLETWLLYTLPLGANRSREELRARTLVGALESICCGITCVQDMLGLIPLDDASTDVVIDAYREIGLRVVFSPMVWDIAPIAMVRDKDELPTDVQEMLGTTGRPIKDQFDYLESQFNRHPAAGTLHWALAPFAPQRCSPKMMQGCADLAHKHDLLVYTQQFCDENENIARHPMAPVWPETMRTTVQFTAEAPDRTRVTVTWEVAGKATAEEMAVFLEHRGSMTQGWSGSFDKLESHLSRS